MRSNPYLIAFYDFFKSHLKFVKAEIVVEDENSDVLFFIKNLISKIEYQLTIGDPVDDKKLYFEIKNLFYFSRYLRAFDPGLIVYLYIKSQKPQTPEERP
jgi:hypothetical protein